MATWQDYLKLMEGLSRTLEQLTQVELDKNTAASRGDVLGVEECMKREQVLSLSLRGCDQKRDAMLAQLGLHGVSLSQLEDRSPPELQLETKRVVEELTPWRSTSGPLSACRPCRLATPLRRRNSAGIIKQTSGPEVRVI